MCPRAGPPGDLLSALFVGYTVYHICNVCSVQLAVYFQIRVVLIDKPASYPESEIDRVALSSDGFWYLNSRNTI